RHLLAGGLQPAPSSYCGQQRLGHPATAGLDGPPATRARARKLIEHEHEQEAMADHSYRMSRRWDRHVPARSRRSAPPGWTFSRSISPAAGPGSPFSFKQPTGRALPEAGSAFRGDPPHLSRLSFSTDHSPTPAGKKVIRNHSATHLLESRNETAGVSPTAWVLAPPMMP